MVCVFHNMLHYVYIYMETSRWQKEEGVRKEGGRREAGGSREGEQVDDDDDDDDCDNVS